MSEQIWKTIKKQNNQYGHTYVFKLEYRDAFNIATKVNPKNCKIIEIGQLFHLQIFVKIKT